VEDEIYTAVFGSWDVGTMCGRRVHTAVNGRCNIRSDEGKVRNIQRCLEGCIYTAVSRRWDIYSDVWKVGNMERCVEVV
jgi:hypothetical protein